MGEILRTGVKVYLPDADAINTCVFKYKTWEKFSAAGIKVPRNMVINNEADLATAFAELAGQRGKIWLRSMDIGGGGKGALPAADFKVAKEWISRVDGWGSFVAAELLSDETVTWLSLWDQGNLVVAQSRVRRGWAHSALSVSGVTGVTKVGETYSSAEVDRVGESAVRAVSAKPHGIYGVDMTYDFDGVPNPTEINIGRFFTTVEFFARAGLNMPVIYKNIALYAEYPELKSNLNPLPNGLLWLRAMDSLPFLTTREKLAGLIDARFMQIQSERGVSGPCN